MDTSNCLGFIILRHVNSEETKRYWKHCYECIRKNYPENNIVIIDDNSRQEFITHHNLYKTSVIQSEYPRRGELLPYVYYLRHKWFDTAVILHDSVFINSYIDFSVKNYKILWEFEHNWDQIKDEKRLIRVFQDDKLNNFHDNKNLWKGCFGCMSVITHDFLSYIQSTHDICLLLDHIYTRFHRCSFERVLACLLQFHAEKETLFGNIHKYCKWGITFDEKDTYSYLPITKVWTGR